MLSSNEERLRKVRETVMNYRYMDDIFMSVALNDKKTINVVLNIIMERELKILSVSAQDTVSNLYGRGARFDVFAEDSDGIIYDIEIQRAKEGADPKRVRFNFAMLDTRSLDKGIPHKKLPRSVVIFITETDTLGDGLPIQHFRLRSDETGKVLQTEQEVIYVDSSCQPDTPLGNLMHDFHCRNAKEIHNKELAARMEHIKSNETEVSSMCQAVEKYGDERHEEGRQEGQKENLLANLRSLMENGFSAAKAMELLKVPAADREGILAQLAN